MAGVCACGHVVDEHDPGALMRCLVEGCGCVAFDELLEEES